MLTVRTRARAGHPWIFSNEIVDPPVIRLPEGGAVRVLDHEGRSLGVGYANPHSLIAVRLCGHGALLDDVSFYVERLERALALRNRIRPGRNSGRLCAGEADGLPGVILDRYGDVCSVQVTTLGMELRLPLLQQAIQQVLNPRAVVLRNDVSLRALENLPLEKRLWWGELEGPVRFQENGASFEVDLLEGQKTGFFFDQADNRAFAAALCSGARVLDVYAYVGAFAVQAMLAGAREAVAVDSSGPACGWIRHNAGLNGVQVATVQEDARDAMEKMVAAGERFEVVSIDPPAFAKSRKAAAAALAGYRTVNTLAIRLVAPGGLLFSSSCSHHIHPDRFEQTLREAAHKAHRELVLIRRGGQAPDHPILPGVPETEYLKHLVFVVR